MPVLPELLAAEFESLFDFIVEVHLEIPRLCFIFNSVYNMAGMVFGKLTVGNRFESRRKDGPNQKHCIRYWLCRCECGNEKWISGSVLRQGQCRSCGCLVKEISGARFRNANHELRLHMRAVAVTHGMSYTKVYKAWQSMRLRCHHPGSQGYGDYGGRGISVYEEWRKDFLAFYQHIGDPPSSRHSVDRINNDGNYEPGNVRWATPIEQRRNRRQLRKERIHV
jgi:hypothetical protein